MLEGTDGGALDHGCMLLALPADACSADDVIAFKGPARSLPGAVSGGTGGPLPPPSPPKPCNKWVTAAEAAADNAAYLQSFSAVCFMTVRNIARMHTHDRPMALVESAWGGSRIEGWMSRRALDTAAPPFAGNAPPVNTAVPNPNTNNANVESSIFNGMVSPWSNFSIKVSDHQSATQLYAGHRE